MLGFGAAKVHKTPYLHSVLISLLQKSELGDSLSVSLEVRMLFSPFLKEEEEIHFMLSLL